MKAFEPTDFIDRRAARRMDRFAQFAVAAARLALEDAGLEITDAMRPRVGAIVGSGIGGLDTFVEQTLIAHERGPDRVSPLFIPMVIANMAGAQVSMELGLKGPLSCISTACASGNHALGDATEVIRRGQADVMLAGGHRVEHHPDGHRRLQRHARALHAQRRPRGRQPPLRRGPRRLRHGRGRRDPGAREPRARHRARRRADLRGARATA